MAEESEVIAASFADPFVLLTKTDKTISVLRADDSAELEELELGEAVTIQKWRSGSLYDDVADRFRLVRDAVDEESPTSILLFLLSEDGGLSVSCSNPMLTGSDMNSGLLHAKSQESSLHSVWTKLPTSLSDP